MPHTANILAGWLKIWWCLPAGL